VKKRLTPLFKALKSRVKHGFSCLKYLVDHIIIVIDRILVTNICKGFQYFLFYYKCWSEYGMEVVSGTLFAMEESIRAKLLAVGATSREKAATVQEAHLDTQEQNWLSYIAGGLFAGVKKAADRRYYVAA
jgi:hypothetical protein